MSDETPVAPVAVAIVSHDSAADLPGCLDAVAALTPGPQEVIVVDCASGDGSPKVAERWVAGRGLDHRDAPPEAQPLQVLPLKVLPLADNLGFAGGMNVAISRTSSPYVLSLNPDARPAKDYLERLLARMEDPVPADCTSPASPRPPWRIGAVTGRLLRPAESASRHRLLDACGMRLTTTWRHLDRGSGEPDRGQHPRAERVFGATGAASLFRRKALLDVAIGGNVFDPLFHSFREDAELAFRLRERGWEILYEPQARCEHRRLNLPERRRRMSSEVNRRSLQNRYLLRLYHQTAGNFWKTSLPTLVRDLLALGWVLVAERSSLPAYGWLWRRRREILDRRRAIQARRTVPSRDIDRWFFTAGMPVAPPASGKRASNRPAPGEPE